MRVLASCKVHQCAWQQQGLRDSALVQQIVSKPLVCEQAYAGCSQCLPGLWKLQHVLGGKLKVALEFLAAAKHWRDTTPQQKLHCCLALSRVACLQGSSSKPALLLL
jgi:hypothetical protein